jgi:anaerobic magnesium-protoporphyrin IX monomethyl ester cyclase
MAFHLGLACAAETQLDVLLLRPRHPMSFWGCPPLGILALAQYLDTRGFRAVVWDCMNDPAATDENLVRVLHEVEIRFVGISFLSSQLREARRLAALVRLHSPATRIVAGGQHVSAVPDEVLDCDHIVIGEGEEALESILNDDRGHERLIRGTPVADLEAVPLPDEAILFHYGAFGCADPLAVMTTRGCPFACNFCLGPEQRSRTPRRYPPQVVGRYLELAYRALGPRNVFFVDDVFTLSRRWVSDVCDEIERRDIAHTGYRCFSHVSVADPWIYQRLAAAGFVQVQVGVESGDDQALRRMGKHYTPAQARDTVAMIKDCGIETNALFLLGYPGDTVEGMYRTLAFAERLQTPLWFSVAQPFPGSRFHDEARRTGTLLEDDYERYSNTDIVYLPDGVSMSDMERVVSDARDLAARSPCC